MLHRPTPLKLQAFSSAATGRARGRARGSRCRGTCGRRRAALHATATATAYHGQLVLRLCSRRIVGLGLPLSLRLASRVAPQLARWAAPPRQPRRADCQHAAEGEEDR
eukprot:scaffold49956_cov63-Phaeocystis_antarctica.AAC.2